MTTDSQPDNDNPHPLGLGCNEGLGAAVPKQESAALWGNIVLLHLWGAVGYLKPGWFPAIAGLAQLVMLCAVFYQHQLEAKLARQKSA